MLLLADFAKKFSFLCYDTCKQNKNMVKYFYTFKIGGVVEIMHVQKEKTPCKKAIWKDTSLLMQKRSTLPSLTFAFLFCLLIAAATYCLIEFAAYVCGSLVTTVLAATIAKIILIVVGLILFLSAFMPLWLAKLRMAGLLWQGIEPSSKDVFYYFTSFSRYARAWRIGTVATLLLALPVAAVIGLFAGAVNLYDAVLWVYFSAPVAVLLFIILILIALVLSVAVLFVGGTCLAFAAVAVGNEQLRLRAAFALAIRAGKHHLMQVFVFSLKSLLWLLLSLLTVGVLFVLWFSHFYNLSYMRLSMALCSCEGTGSGFGSCGMKEETV